jgi:deoxyribodipyrimidine photo-lyase
MSTAIVWFRKDLRLGDNPAWADATSRFDTVVAVFVVDPELWDRCAPARVALLASHLRALDHRLGQSGGRLLVERGDPVVVLEALSARYRAEEVVFNADVTPYAVRRDRQVAERCAVARHWGSLVHAPGSILTDSGTPYQVFTPFSKRWFEAGIPEPDEAGDATVAADPGTGIPKTADPPLPGGEEAAWRRLEEFEPRVDSYRVERDRPDLDATSRLSIDLKYGAISPGAIARHLGTATEGRLAFVRQLAWRDFYAHLMAERPDTVDRPMRGEYQDIAWRDDPNGFAAWATGQTGYPIVDAGMRQLAAEGWMHNRVRMITASFLVKDLLIDWRKGERFFRRRLLDGDVPQNVGNWQWTAGTGADAAPYFRIFNPVTQSKRFDPDGEYIRRWVPELAGVPARWIHAPWEAPPLELAAAGVIVGDTYPAPIVDHATARQRTLDAYQRALG